MRHRKNPVAKAKSNIQWCQAQIAIARSGGETGLYTVDEWIACMHRVIEANESILKDYGVTSQPNHP